MKFANAADAVNRPTDTVIVIDASPSMDDTDLKPTRLKGAKKAVMALLDLKAKQHPDDRVGIASFNMDAKQVHALSDIKHHLETLKSAATNINTGWNTNIAAGLAMGHAILNHDEKKGSDVVAHAGGYVQRLFDGIFGAPAETTAPANQPQASRAKQIILLSDGCSNTGGNPVSAANKVKACGIEIDVIGIGGSHDSDGLDEATLKKIASRSSDSSPRYCFISDTGKLIQEFKRLGGHIRAIPK